jgi:hypothetical protein
MRNIPDSLGMTGLLFFGSMSSSNFHEIKNALAIIYETAGLLDDIAHTAGGDISIDPERMKNLAGKITKQVKRADGIIKNINRFSHSVEKPIERIDLGETVAFVAKLSEQLAAVRGITVIAAPISSHIHITTSPFFLENLIWVCLDFAMGCTGDGKTVELVTEATGNGGRVRFAKLDCLDRKGVEIFSTREATALLETLEADLITAPETSELIISLPKMFKQGDINT